MDFNKIFKPSTMAKLNKQSQENLKKMLGNKSLMQTMISSQKLLGEIEAAEAPYKEQLEELAKEMVEKLYPIIEDEGITLDAKIVGMDDVNSSLDEIKVNKPLSIYDNIITLYLSFLDKKPQDHDLISKSQQLLIKLGWGSNKPALPRKANIFIKKLPSDIQLNLYKDLLKLDKNVELDEIKVNKPSQYIHGRENNFKTPERGKNVKQTINNLLKINPYLSEKQVVEILSEKLRWYNSKVVMDNIRSVPGIQRHQVTNPTTGRKLYTYYIGKEDINEQITPESRRRIINAVTQGAALKGAFSFYLFKDYLDAIDPSLIDKYNEIMKNSFGIYDDDNAIAMMLSALAQGHKAAGGSSKVILKEIKINNPLEDKVEKGSTLDLFLKSISKNPQHSKYEEMKNKYPKYFQNINESQESGITIRARALNFPMLVHEIIKGLYELVSLQGFKGDKQQNQDVVDKVDTLANEPHDIRYGQQIFEALNDIFADSQYNDPRIREHFFSEIYQLDDEDFIEYVENAINGELTPHEKRWTNQVLKEISYDLKDDDFSATGINEGKIPSMSQIKDYARQGLLTAALATALLSSPKISAQDKEIIKDTISTTQQTKKQTPQEKRAELEAKVKAKNAARLAPIEAAQQKRIDDWISANPGTTAKDYWAYQDKRKKGDDTPIDGLNGPSFKSTKCGISKQHAKDDKKSWGKMKEIRIIQPTLPKIPSSNSVKISQLPNLKLTIGKYDLAKGRKGMKISTHSKQIDKRTLDRAQIVFNKLGKSIESAYVGWLPVGNGFSYPSTFLKTSYNGQPIIIAQTQTSEPRAGQIYIYSDNFKSGKLMRLPDYHDIWQDNSTLFADKNATKEQILQALKIEE